MGTHRGGGRDRAAVGCTVLGHVRRIEPWLSFPIHSNWAVHLPLFHLVRPLFRPRPQPHTDHSFERRTDGCAYGRGHRSVSDDGGRCRQANNQLLPQNPSRQPWTQLSKIERLAALHRSQRVAPDQAARTGSRLSGHVIRSHLSRVNVRSGDLLICRQVGRSDAYKARRQATAPQITSARRGYHENADQEIGRCATRTPPRWGHGATLTTRHGNTVGNVPATLPPPHRQWPTCQLDRINPTHRGGPRPVPCQLARPAQPTSASVRHPVPARPSRRRRAA